MASIRKKPGSPHWYACYRGADDRRIQVSTKLTNAAKAMAMAEGLEQAARLAAEDKLSETRARDLIEAIYRKASGESLPTAITRDFLSNWAESTKGVLSLRTYQAYAQVARDFIAQLGPKADRDLTHITTHDLTRFRDEVARRTSKSNASKQLKYLRVGLGQAWRENLLRENPAAKVRVFSSKESARRPFQLSEIRQVLAQADGEWRGLILFGYYTGQRLSDIARLRWSDINLDQQVIRHSTSKRGRRMEIPLAPELMDYLSSLPKSTTRHDPIFPQAYPIASVVKGDSRLSQQFHGLLVKAKLAEARGKESTGKGRAGPRPVGELSYHSLRYSLTSMLKSAGVSEAITMDIVGHDSKAVSRSYTRIELGAKIAALGKIPKLSDEPSQEGKRASDPSSS